MKSKLKNLIIAAAMIISASACNDEDTDFVIPKGENNEVNIQNSVYTHQTYYDLSTNNVVLTVENTDWDLEVETSGEMKIIKLNPANSYRVFKTSSKDITEDITIPDEADWRYDDPSGDINDFAFSDWEDNDVYVIAKKVISYDPTAPSISVFARISFSHQNGGIELNWVLEGENDINSSLLPSTDQAHPYTWFSFDTKGEAAVQPPAPDSYDLIITTYTDEIEDGDVTFDMEVRGVLINIENNTSSYRYEPGEATDEEYIEIFNNITKDDIDITEFDDDADEIGYEWKEFNRNSMSYEIDKSNMYFIKDGDGNYYKLRFTNFYDSTGEKGYISFTYALL
ncbi:MAG: hypothetical protein GXO47_12910 [Chlorobi bacterium]|nr:hypothetical protein [Chlorobiota bacterium]